jgi:hypothetical protein
MEHLQIEGVRVHYDPRITRGEIDTILVEEKMIYAAARKELGTVELTLDGSDEITVKSTEKSPIIRVRRITGYLSKIDNFNDGKKAELADRTTHWLFNV